MTASSLKKTPLRPVAGEAPGSDFFYDELMTAQPEATRDFFRARLTMPATREDEAKKRD